MSSYMRAKVTVESVTRHQTSETLVFRPVCKKGGYPSDGTDEDNTYAKFSPSGRFELTVTNPGLLGQFEPGEQYYVDFKPVPVDSKS